MLFLSTLPESQINETPACVLVKKPLATKILALNLAVAILAWGFSAGEWQHLVPNHPADVLGLCLWMCAHVRTSEGSCTRSWAGQMVHLVRPARWHSVKARLVYHIINQLLTLFYARLPNLPQALFGGYDPEWRCALVADAPMASGGLREPKNTLPKCARYWHVNTAGMPNRLREMDVQHALRVWMRCYLF